MPFLIQLAQTIDLLFREGKMKWVSGHHVAVEVEGEVWEAVAEGFVQTTKSAFRIDYFKRKHYKIVDEIELQNIDFQRFKLIKNTKYDYYSLLFSHWVQSLSQIALYGLSYGFIRSGFWIGRKGTSAYSAIYCNEAVAFVINQPYWWKQLPYQTINFAKNGK